MSVSITNGILVHINVYMNECQHNKFKQAALATSRITSIAQNL